MDLSQLFIAPTWSWRTDGGHAFGISAILAGQRFKATGLEEFGIASAGYDTSVGGGARLGWTWQASQNLKVGATYQSRLWMTRFDKYAGLFAERGGFDIPSNYAVGFAYKIDSSLTWAFDVERIHYSEVNSVGNPGSSPGNFGDADGPGFGWKDVTVIKTGLAYEVSPTLTVRLGYNHTTQPIGASEVYFNQLAPGVVRHHATLGATWQANASTEVSFFYAHAFEATVSGSSPYPIALRMNQDSVGFSLNWKH
jgi:long-chain fatty acid transport protein